MKEEKKVLKFSDDVIVVIREMVQLSLLTGTNVIDHFRSIRLVETENGYITVTEEFVEAYQKMLKDLEEQAAKLQEEAEKNIIKS